MRLYNPKSKNSRIFSGQLHPLEWIWTANKNCVVIRRKFPTYSQIFKIFRISGFGIFPCQSEIRNGYIPLSRNEREIQFTFIRVSLKCFSKYFASSIANKVWNGKHCNCFSSIGVNFRNNIGNERWRARRDARAQVASSKLALVTTPFVAIYGRHYYMEYNKLVLPVRLTYHSFLFIDKFDEGESRATDALIRGRTEM